LGLKLRALQILYMHKQLHNTLKKKENNKSNHMTPSNKRNLELIELELLELKALQYPWPNITLA